MSGSLLLDWVSMRALLSVSDKSGLIEFARRLADAGVDLVSTGGTQKTLVEAGLQAVAVEDVTGFPEILDGRVKTLHPLIHGGILAKASPGHRSELEEHGIDTFELVVVNLYPFREAARRQGSEPGEILEQIDIGGPTMIRAAAKNHPRVAVVVSPDDYPEVARAIEEQGHVPPDLRVRLARKAFAHTASYDAAITQHFDELAGDVLPPSLHLALDRVDVLRYGENPHQSGARYRDAGLRGGGFWNEVVQHKGQALSYLNVFDADAAWRLVHDFDAPAAAVIKHANPCGFAVADTIAEAYASAFACDPKSAFGGVVACNREVDAATAAALMANPKCDVLIAPSYSAEALERLEAKRKNMRVLHAPPPGAQGLEVRTIDGGLLVQDADRVRLGRSDWRVVTEAKPSDAQWRDLEVAWMVCAHTRSNAIVLVRDGQAVGVGAGQQSRVDAAELASSKAGRRAAGGACASDAFFPFRDGLDAAVSAGVSAVIQPGGSVRDPEVIEAADEHGIVMVLTGTRHFRH